MSNVSWLSEHTEEENCYFTTLGRSSGNPHEVEIWFGVIDDTLYLICGNGPTADWYRNAMANSAVTIRIADQTHAGIARDVVDPPERRRVGELMGAKYPWDGDPSIGLTFDAWCFGVPALAIESWTVVGE